MLTGAMFRPPDVGCPQAVGCACRNYSLPQVQHESEAINPKQRQIRSKSDGPRAHENLCTVTRILLCREPVTNGSSPALSWRDLARLQGRRFALGCDLHRACR